MNQSRSLFALAAVAGLIAAAPASAQMTPIEDVRELNVHAQHGGVTDFNVAFPPGFFLPFQDVLTASAVSLTGEAHSEAFQSSQFFPAAIYFSGHANGGWSGGTAGQYDGLSHVYFRVRMDNCVQYSFYSQVAPGDLAGSAWVEVRGPGGVMIHVGDRDSTITGELAPGEYEFEGRSSVASSAGFVDGGTYAIIWTVTPCPGSIITLSPTDLVVACDAPATFCVTPAGPVGNFTYQWRKNYVPILDSAHFTGATTPCLTIHHACYADVASYDVVVSAGATGQPSNPAHLGISTIAVGVDPASGGWTLGPATPNPFGVATSCRYVAPRPFFARVAVYDAAGRQVRRLVDGMLEASGSITWDGRTEAGASAVQGVYFLRIDADDHREVRRIALVR